MSIPWTLHPVRCLVIDDPDAAGLTVPVNAVYASPDKHAAHFGLDQHLRTQNLPAFPDQSGLHPRRRTQPLSGRIKLDPNLKRR